ncbi:MAG: SUMF1/EgtB/PvdO family nonheme iron enzyme [Tepidisphaeraceae bacterium]|jgi:formylglycine-generating enzyme required for sulfatase activity
MPAGQVSVQFVTVGDPGNAPDTNGLGSVPYTFQMGECDITAGEYTEFLNAVATTDPYGLYDLNMNPASGFAACGIVRTGNPGTYSYSVVAGDANFPVNEVTWGDAARFCNWLANGQPATGAENASTTEDGSYALNGALTDQQLAAVTRSSSARYVIPTQNEWYKAAFYKGGSTNAGYWLYPTQSDTPPSNVLSATGDNNANFLDPVLGLTDPLNGLTPVGAFVDSPGPYGTFDMGGDVSQWDETEVNTNERVIGGAAFNVGVSYLESDNLFASPGSTYASVTGFRIAELPEPNSLALLAVAAAGLLRRKQRPAV